MTVQRWWNLAFAGALSLMAAVAVFESDSTDTARTGALITLGLIGLGYTFFAHRAIDGGIPEGRPGQACSSVVLRVIVVLGCGIATAFSANMATLQSLAFPLLWVLAGSVAAAIVWNAVLALTMVAGLVVSLGGTTSAVQQALVIEGLAFVFALALGFWITRISAVGEEQRRLVAELTAAQGQLAALHRAAGGASERERLAREMHDTIAQSLTSLVMLAQRTRVQLTAVTGDTAAARESVDLIESYGRDALTEARSLVASMAPVRAGESSLTDALERLAERFERETGIQVDAAVRAVGLDRELEVVLLRCAQEGLANVRKHSRASVASVALIQNGEFVTLLVTDNGRGLRNYSAAREMGFGLAGMRERVHLVGGSLEVLTRETGGTELRVRVHVTATTETGKHVETDAR